MFFSFLSNHSVVNKNAAIQLPPVIPSPRPEIMGTLRPQAARAGARANDTLSPTPPNDSV